MHALDRLEGLGAVAGLVEGDEPLVDGAEDDGGLRAPAVRVAVDVFRLGEERDVAVGGVGGGEFFEDREIGGPKTPKPLIHSLLILNGRIRIEIQKNQGRHPPQL